MKTDLTTSGSVPVPKASKPEVHKQFLATRSDPKSVQKNSPDYKVDLSISSKVPDMSSAEMTERLLKEPKEILKIESTARVQKRPAIFFVKGLDVFSSPSKSEGAYAGIGKISESVLGSRIYGWDQKEDMMKEIRKVHPDYPVILVGHSLGGDTVIEIADELDTLKEGFRSIDLLVTIDAVGMGHDIIPQNVKRHLNVFGETSSFLNDGPHVARREEKTNVRNILSHLDHTDIDDDREIQFEIVRLVEETLKSRN